MSIQINTLDRENPLGVFMCFCPRCGGDAPELVLTGNRRQKRECRGCGTLNYGTREHEACGKCKEHAGWIDRGRIQERERLPGSLCKKCEDEVKIHRAAIEAGGIYFECKACGKSGVIQYKSEGAKAFCDKVRKHLGVEFGQPAGAEFNHCSQHGEG